MKRYTPEIHRNLRLATSANLKLRQGHRIETAIDISDGNRQVFVLDRYEIISREDGVALSAGKVKMPSPR